MNIDRSIDIESQAVRKRIIAEIEGDENIRRKSESFKRFEIYRELQHKYIIDKLCKESSQASVASMRTVTSINLTRKMINELSSLYKDEPTRSFTDLSASQDEVIYRHYERNSANVKFKKANRYYKLHEQCAIQTVPKFGQIDFRVLQPHHYDVVPHQENPEHGEIYIISNLDRERLRLQTGEGDVINQKIADPDDWKSRKIYYWWSAEYNFKTNFDGAVLDEKNQVLSTVDFDDLKNPIEMLNFTDIANEKDFEYWVRSGSAVTNFNIDFGASISDTSNINKMQGYAQAVFKSVESPQNLVVGPHNVIWLKVDPKDTDATTPEFSFINPGADLSGGIAVNENLLQMFLASREGSLAGAVDDKTYSSALERLLAMIERFEASKDDLSLFTKAEQSVWEQFKLWNNLYSGSPEFIKPDLNAGQITESSELEIEYAGPEMVQTKQDKLEYVSKQMDLGVMDEIEAIQEIRGVTEDEAEQVLKRIKERSSQLSEMMVSDQGDVDAEAFEGQGLAPEVGGLQ